MTEFLENIRIIFSSIWKNKNLTFFFLIGLFSLDFSIRVLGDHLATGSHWNNTTFSKLIKSKNVDVLLIGTCRTANNIDSRIISKELNLNVFNAGKQAEALGNMDLALNLALSKHNPKYVIIQIDTVVLTQDFIAIKNEVERQIVWFRNLSSTREKSLREKYGLNNTINNSGFWRYRGQGENLEIALHKMFSRDFSNFNVSDGFLPHSPANHLKIIWYGKNGQAEVEYSEHSINSILSLIQSIREANATPILLVTPMHYSVGNLNKMRGLLEEIAIKENITILNYVDERSEISRDNSLWYDGTHLDQNGAEKFSKILAKDLKSLGITK